MMQAIAVHEGVIGPRLLDRDVVVLETCGSGRKSPLFPPVRQAPPHLPGRLHRVEGFRVERAADPVQQLLVLLMLGVACYVAVEAVGRIGEPVEVQTGPMLTVGAMGLAVNIVALLLLRGGSAESLNVKGAYLEVVADAAGSVGVLAAGWLAPGGWISIETARGEAIAPRDLALEAERDVGAARITLLRRT